MNSTALRAGLLSIGGAYLATTEAERRPQSITGHKKSVVYDDHPYDITHMVFANEEYEKFYFEKLEQARYQGWQGIKLRYPEYSQKQKPVIEILAEMERKRAENSTDGNKE